MQSQDSTSWTLHAEGRTRRNVGWMALLVCSMNMLVAPMEVFFDAAPEGTFYMLALTSALYRSVIFPLNFFHAWLLRTQARIMPVRLVPVETRRRLRLRINEQDRPLQRAPNQFPTQEQHIKRHKTHRESASGSRPHRGQPIQRGSRSTQQTA